MYNNPEVNELKQRYSILLEQYQRLQGTIKVLRATADELEINLKKVEEERDKYKKAFESIFTENIGDAWEQMPDEDKKGMTVDKKLSFFENEINASKLYIRRQMLAKMADIKEENHQLKTEMVKLKATLKEKERQFENATTINGIGASNTKGSLLEDDDISVPMQSHSAPKASNLKQDVFNKIAAALGGNNATHAAPVSQAVKTQPKPSPKPEEKSVPKPAGKKPSEEIEHHSTSAHPTTKFFERFRKMPEATQAQFKASLPKLDAALAGTEYGKDLLTIIGSTGLYTYADIFKQGIEKGLWVASKDWKTRKDINALVSLNFLTKTSIKSFTGHPQQVYLLSQMGEAWYALTTFKDPLKSLYIIQSKEQKSGPHAMLIQNMIAILKAHGYETFQEVGLKTKSTGEESIADISANKGEFTNIRIECEMGNYDKDAYVYKFTKALEVSDRLLVGVPIKSTKEKIQGIIEEGIIREQYHGLDNFSKQGKFFKVFTLKELTDDPDLILPQKRKR